MKLDIGCGNNKQAGFVGMDAQYLPGVDVVHNWTEYPWPFKDGAVEIAVANHVIEHVNPADFGFIRWMDEMWRIMQPGGQLHAAMPYAGTVRFWQDPTHVNGCTENTFAYFDPETHNGALYQNYSPQPWKIEHMERQYNGDLYVILSKRGDT